MTNILIFPSHPSQQLNTFAVLCVKHPVVSRVYGIKTLTYYDQGLLSGNIILITAAIAIGQNWISIIYNKK